MEEQDNLKSVITERFITAVDYLMVSGKIPTIVEFERITGIRAQRITGMRAYITGESKTSHYVGINHIKLVKDAFGVSMDFIFDGIKPILIEKNEVHEKVNDESKKALKLNLDLKEDVDILKEKVKLLNEKVDFYKEMVSQRL